MLQPPNSNYCKIVCEPFTFWGTAYRLDSSIDKSWPYRRGKTCCPSTQQQRQCEEEKRHRNEGICRRGTDGYLTSAQTEPYLFTAPTALPSPHAAKGVHGFGGVSSHGMARAVSRCGTEGYLWSGHSELQFSGNIELHCSVTNNDDGYDGDWIMGSGRRSVFEDG